MSMAIPARIVWLRGQYIQRLEVEAEGRRLVLRCRRDDRFIPVDHQTERRGHPHRRLRRRFSIRSVLRRDAFYASVVTRFVTYGLSCRRWQRPIAMQCWRAADDAGIDYCRGPQGRAAGDVRDLLSGYRAGEL